MKDKLKKMTEERSELKQIIDQKYVKPSCKRSIKKPTRKKGKTQKKKKVFLKNLWRNYATSLMIREKFCARQKVFRRF